MITILITFFTSVVSVYCQARYPAGIDPKTCPNYPDCNNPLAAIQVAAPQYQPFGSQLAQPQQSYQQPQAYQPQYQQQPQYQPSAPHQPEPQYSPAAQAALDRGEYIGDGDYHGEGQTEESLGSAYNQGPLLVRYTNPRPAPVVEYRQSDARQYSPAAPVPVSPQYSHTQLFSPVQTAQYKTPSPIQYSAGPANSPVQYSTGPQTYNANVGSSGTFSAQYNPVPLAYQPRSYQQPVNLVDKSQQVQPLPAQIPADLDPRACPNYPFCH